MQGREQLRRQGTQVYHVEHNFLWKTLALFINTNREEITRHLLLLHSVLCIFWDEELRRVEGYL